MKKTKAKTLPVDSSNEQEENAIILKESGIIKKIKKLSPGIPEDKLLKILEVVENYSIDVSEFHSGPLPSPRTLHGYKLVNSTFPDRIMKMTEEQSAHRQKNESRMVMNGTRNEFLGMLLAFIIVMTAIIGGIFLIYTGKDLSGLTSIIIGIVSAASVFIGGKRYALKELEIKTRDMKSKKD